MKNTCAECYKEFLVKKYTLSRIRQSPQSLTGRFCSIGCLNKYKARHKIGAASQFKVGGHIGEKNFKWKGNAVSYGALHDWVSYHLGKPNQCEHCGRNDTPEPGKRIYEWASKSKDYRRDLSDWIRLCRKCHDEYDDRTHGLREYNQNKHIKRTKRIGKSGFKNVKITPEGRYRTYININKKRVNLGNYDTAEEAYGVYKAKALELYGEF